MGNQTQEPAGTGAGAKSAARPAGDIALRWKWVESWVGLVLAVAICVVTASCTSIYRRTRAQLPPEPAAELNLRLAEAEKAARLTRQAGATLYESLQKQPLHALNQADFDRLEAAAFDLERRVLAARDVAQEGGGPGSTDSEIERLNAEAQAWLAYVRDQRTADPATRIGALRSLLAKTPGGD